MENYIISILSFYGFSLKILSCTHILPMPLLQANNWWRHKIGHA